MGFEQAPSGIYRAASAEAYGLNGGIGTRRNCSAPMCGGRWLLDWRGKPYFCDFVWMTPAGKLGIEIKGFGPHVRDMDRDKYCYELNRETFLCALGFQVISMSDSSSAGRVRCRTCSFCRAKIVISEENLQNVHPFTIEYTQMAG